MMVLVEKSAPNGLGFMVGEVPGLTPLTLTTSSTEKLVHDVHLSFDLHENSYKYGPEMVLSAWSTRFPQFKPRSLESGYFRVEVPVPLRQFYDLNMELLPLCHARLSGVR